MRSASVSSSPSVDTALRMACAMSSAVPASVPCSSRQAPSTTRMVLPCSTKESVFDADSRHRVRDQHEAVVALAAQGELQRHGVDVMAIDDDAAPGRVVVQGGAHDARLARRERRHRVEEMREAAQPVRDAPRALREGRVAVSRRDDDAARGELGE